MSLDGYNTIKKSRSSLKRADSRIRNRYLKIAEEDPTTYDLDNMSGHLTSLETTASHFLKSQNEIMEYSTNSVETPFNEDDELNAIDVFEDGVTATRSLINRLRTTKLAMLGIDSIKASIEDLEERSHSHPEQDCSVTLSELKLEHKLLTDKTSASTIPRDHLIHHEISRLRSRLQALNLRV